VLKWDELGGVFAPALERNVITPVYGYGDGRVQDPVFTCPVSAIPDAVWQIVDLWLTCRAMKALPIAGGVLDQPLVVQRAWPVLEAAIAPLERRQSQDGQVAAMASMLGAVGVARGRK
jgi:hypothetical protein